MAENSKIEWTDSTVNFWWGCTKVGPGCDHCYAETWSKRTGGNIWGTGVARRKIKSAVALLHRLNGDTVWPIMANRSRRVFIQSMSDLFDLEVPVEWFAEAWQTIERCGQLNIQIVTKRISAVEKRLAAIGVTTWPKHAGLMITVCNQAEADRDIPRLLELKMKLGIPWVGLSMEPLLGRIDLTKAKTGQRRVQSVSDSLNSLTGESLNGHGEYEGMFTITRTGKLDWVVVGGESGKGARPMHPDWVRAIRDDCKEDGVAFFFKQWGEYREVFTEKYELVEDDSNRANEVYDSAINPSFIQFDGTHILCRDDLPFDEDNAARLIERVGKKAAGRTLDGTTHNEFPEVT